MKNGKKINFFHLLIAMVFVLIPKSGYSIEYGKPLNKKDFDLKGPVVYAIIKDCQYKEEFGELKKTGSNDTRVYFLSNGYIYEEVLSPTSYIKYEYDNHGHLLEETEINIGKGKLYQINNESIYDDDTARIIKYNNTYTTDGRISEIKKFVKRFGSFEQIERVVYKYEPSGNKIIVYDLFGVLKEITNNGSTCIQKTDTKAFYWEVLTDRLDSKGHIVRRNKTFEYSDGKKRNISNEIMAYDDHSNIIKQTTYLSRDNKTPSDVITLKYTYDSFGNWKRKMVYRGKKLLSWQERDITYASDESDYDIFVQNHAKQEELRKNKINKIKKTIEIEEEKENAKGPIVSVPDYFAHFPGKGDSSLFNWIERNKPNVLYHESFIVEFIVERDGSLSNIKILRGSSSDSEEAIRLVKKMPKWIPANKDGEAVRSITRIRIEL